mmetsp:Transcript_13094/g.33409  ORF Transcript_13094/g.33409 Transcript_13094/m.33409 type:complete len:715 (-) Transcript_13094:50-2194(-)|eukprot:CAMPEP_0177650098 /NCGR_PEP_ID=MMETSP0447-20121125/11748_1 /TAXON_ID=0 /ORGANISM="Stygamoeba regulata, Strain BSH-02190019" /LENGTH=714 /DNA_ID=CAMNT_0019152919 /DNA_START=44 /DNA_END=2188 /DNA_ORIENTATION=+
MGKFAGRKCNLLLKLAVNRIKLHRNKKIESTKVQKKEIGGLLAEGKHDMARIRTTSVIFEDYMLEVYNILELYCEMLVPRTGVLETQRDCPPELKQAVCGLLYSAPFVGIEELLKLRTMFLKKYGKRFPEECVHGCCIDPKLIQRLKRDQPDDGLVNYYLKHIATSSGLPPLDEPAPLEMPEPPTDPLFPSPPSGGSADVSSLFPTVPESRNIETASLFPSTPSFEPAPAQTPAPVYVPAPAPAPAPSMDDMFDDLMDGDDLMARFAALSGPSTNVPPTASVATQVTARAEEPDELDALWAQTDSLTTGYGVAGSLAPSSSSSSTGSAYASVSASSAIGNVAVVVDNGSGLLKAGMAGDSLPRAVIPSIVGRVHASSRKVMENKSGGSDTYVGEAAQAHRGILELSHPVTQGVVVDWDAMTSVWEHTFRDALRIQVSEHPVLMTEAPLNPLANRKQMAEILFERFGTPAINVQIQAIMGLYATGRTTGVVLDVGDGVAHAVPVWDGYVIKRGIGRINLGGRNLTEYLQRILSETGISLNTSSQAEIVRDIKEKLGYVAYDFASELEVSRTSAAGSTVPYTLPDGSTITLSTERFRCAEPMFAPPLLGREAGGVQDIVFGAVAQSDVDMRRDLLSNIVLSGGSTCFRGFPERLEKELRALAPGDVPVKVAAPSQRQHLVWMGASALASSPAFATQWITRQQFEELGPSALGEQYR